MADLPPSDSQEHRAELGRQIAQKEARRIRAQQESCESIWSGFSVFGIIGWSVAVPTVLGVALGLWIDHTWPSRFSWTLMLLCGGIMLGCWNAWYWVSRERQRIERRKGKNGDG